MSEEEKPTPMSVASVSHEGKDFLVLKLDKMGHTFEYRPGQTISLEVEVENCDDRCNYRTFSIASSPTEGDYIIVGTRIIQSAFKKTLAQLKPGDPVQVWGPYGDIFTIDEIAKAIVMLTRGIGITPLRSFVIYYTHRQLDMPATLIYESEDDGHFLFKNDLELAAKQTTSLKAVFVSRTPGLKKETIQSNLPMEPSACLFYVSGPPAYTKELIQLAFQAGAKPGKLRAESFTGY